MIKQVKEKYEQQGVAMTCRSFQEYRDMFMLEQEDLQKTPILDVAAGASSFVKESNQQGYTAFAVDPLYASTAQTLEQRGFNEIEEATRKLEKVAHLYRWDYYGSLAHHHDNRERSLSKFIDDFKMHKNRNRYRVGTLPNLPFEDDQFSLILCSHFLFLYEEQFDLDFHHAALKELLRVCKRNGEVRIYPLVGFDGKLYKQIKSLQEKLEQDGARVDYIPTNFHFLRNATLILRLRKSGG